MSLRTLQPVLCRSPLRDWRRSRHSPAATETSAHKSQPPENSQWLGRSPESGNALSPRLSSGGNLSARSPRYAAVTLLIEMAASRSRAPQGRYLGWGSNQNQAPLEERHATV